MLSFCLYFYHVVFVSVPLVAGLFAEKSNGTKQLSVLCGVGEVPHYVVKCLFFFPLRDTSSHIFISTIGKICIVNVKPFMLFIPHWRLSPNQYSQRSYENLPSLFYSFTFHWDIQHCGLLYIWLIAPSVGILQADI